MCPYSLSIPGGVGAQVLGLARAQRRAGHEVTVLAPSDGPPPEAGVRTLGSSVPLAANGSIARIAPDVACALRTIAALRDTSYDVLHLHEPMVPGPTLTALLYTDRPVVATFHRSGGSTAYAGLGPILLRWARRIHVRAVVSEDARSTAQAVMGGDYELLFNAVDVELFRDPPPTPADGPTVFFIGRHEDRKGLAVLLEAVSRMASPPTVWVASDGPQTAELKSRYGQNGPIKWLGRISDAERASRMKGAGVCCFPSLRGESFGLVLLESMAAGTPVVASDIDGYRRVVGEAGVLVPPADPAALAAALATLLADAGERARLARAGSERAAELSMDRLAGLYLDLYDRAAAVKAARDAEAKKGRPEGRPFLSHSAR